MLSLGFEFEGTVDERAPFGWASADEVKEVMIGCGAIIRDAAKQSNVAPHKTVPRCLEGRSNFHESVQVVGANCNETFKISKSGGRGHTFKRRKVRLRKDFIGGDVQPRSIWFPTNDSLGDPDVYCLVTFINAG